MFLFFFLCCLETLKPAMHPFWNEMPSRVESSVAACPSWPYLDNGLPTPAAEVSVTSDCTLVFDSPDCEGDGKLPKNALIMPLSSYRCPHGRMCAYPWSTASWKGTVIAVVKLDPLCVCENGMEKRCGLIFDFFNQSELNLIACVEKNGSFISAWEWDCSGCR